MEDNEMLRFFTRVTAPGRDETVANDVAMSLGVIVLGIVMLFFLPSLHAVEAWDEAWDRRQRRRRADRTRPRPPLRSMPDGAESCPNCHEPRRGGMLGLHECTAVTP